MKESLPAQFSDSEGREWNLRFNVGNVDAIRKKTGINFSKLKDGSVFLELLNDYEKLAEVLWHLIEKQAAGQDVSPESFADALDGEALDAGLTAITEAVINFQGSAQRQAISDMIAKTLEGHEKSMQAVCDWIERESPSILEGVARDTTARLDKLSQESGLTEPAKA